MMIELILVALIGILAGGVVNLLSDDLPYRRMPTRPRYADGTPRPISAWLGLSAFLLGQRLPTERIGEDRYSRPHQTPGFDPEAPSQEDEIEEGTVIADAAVDTPPLWPPDDDALRLSWRYPLTEMFTAALMILTYFVLQDRDFTLVETSVYLFYMFVFSVITIIDIEYRLVLFIVVVPSMVLAVLVAYLFPIEPTLRDSLSGGLMGFGIFAAMFIGGIVFNLLVNRNGATAFGFGDVMLITLCGFLLGFGETFFAIFLITFLGAGGAVIYIVARSFVFRDYQRFTAIPYGPYIVAGTIIMLLFGDAVSRAIIGYPV